MEKIKSAYLLWHEYHSILPKTQRYSLGNKIDKIFVEIIELLASAAFLPPEKKLPYIDAGVRKFDTLKILLMILWETKSFDNKQYVALSIPLNEVGKMLGGWKGQTERSLNSSRDKQNPAR